MDKIKEILFYQVQGFKQEKEYPCKNSPVVSKIQRNAGSCKSGKNGYTAPSMDK